MTGWIVDLPEVPRHPPCVVLTDPDHDSHKCGRPTSGRTVLDLPICDGCYEAVAAS